MLAGLTLLFVACAATPPAATTSSAGDDDGLPPQDGSVSAHDGSASGAPTTPSSAASCSSGANEDNDGDGFTRAAGDCDDCEALVNPGAFDVPNNGIDEDCRDGDDGGDGCEDALAIDDFDPRNGARALGLCRFVAQDDAGWGVLEARYVSVDGSRSLAGEEALRVGLLPAFGMQSPRAGARMLALSSGVARDPQQADWSDNCGDAFTIGTDGWPDGYPRPSPACGNRGGGGGVPLLFDPTALELSIRVPSNAKGLSFETSFFTNEYPDYICSQYNDYFVVLMDPRPAGLEDDNISFDDDGNWISVNNSLLRVCKPGQHGGKTFTCPATSASLANTGYDADDTACGEGAGTGWLKTTVPVIPGSVIRLRFSIWDTGDPNRDSTVLIDNFLFQAESPEAVETVPVVI